MKQNIKRIKITNYTAIADLELSFEPGKVYLLSGPNQAGKSGLLESIKALMTNARMVPLEDSLREGESYLRLEAELESGHTLIRQEGINKGRTIIYPDGQSLSDPLLDDDEWDKIASVIIGEDECLNFRTQGNRLIFKETTPSSTHKIIARVTKTDLILDCTKEARGRLKEASAKYASLSEQLDIIDSNLPKVSNLDFSNLDQLKHDDKVLGLLEEYHSIVDKLEELESTANVPAKQLDKLDKLAEQGELLSRFFILADEIEGLTADIGETISDEELISLENNILITELLEEYLDNQEELEKLQLVDSTELDKAEELVEDLKEIDNLIDLRDKFLAEFAKLNEFTAEVERLKSTVNICNSCGQEILV